MIEGNQDSKQRRDLEGGGRGGGGGGFGNVGKINVADTTDGPRIET